MICDAASVREGLLHVLGGGITHAFANSLPAPVAHSVGLLIDLSPHEARRPHEVHLTVKSPSEKKVFEAMGGFQAIHTFDANAHGYAAFPMPFMFQAEEYGQYSVRISVDVNAETERLFLWVARREIPLVPPGGQN